MTGSYGGDANDNTSTSSTLTQTVNKANTTVALASSANPSTFGSSVTFTATVSPSAATGTVTFKDGSTTLGTGTLSGGGASFATSTLAAGSHSIKASYGGDANDNSGTSATLTQTVNQASAVALTTSANPSPYGTAVTFVATVSPSTATGTVTFNDGSTALGTGTIASGIATYTTSTLSSGAHSITAVYGGSGTYASSTSPVVTQNVLTITSISVTPQNASLPIGATQQFTATGTFSDGSQGNVTASSAWSSSNSSVATVSTTGIATGITEGPTTIQAAIGSIYGSTALTGTPSRFRFTGSLNTARYSSTATALSTGKVLIAGGENDISGDLSETCELYDPTTGTFTLTGGLHIPRVNYTATLLATGMVLITGGQSETQDGTLIAQATVELYDPVAGTFSPTGSLNTARHNHAATLLNNGQVLIAGGVDGSSNVLGTAELYDPTTGTFTLTGSLNTVRWNHTATLLNDGTVLVAGGDDSFNNTYTTTSELYNTTTGAFTTTGSLNIARDTHTATLLSNGMVLVAGGEGANVTSLASAELYDPVAKVFKTTGSLVSPRIYDTATLLNSGQVLLAGGINNNDNILASGELYDPVSGTFSLAGNLNVARTYHGAALLSDGTVLIAGGLGVFDENNGAPLSSAEIYDSATPPPPPYSLQITPAVANIAVGGTQQFTAVDNHGYPLQDVTWTVSDPSLATVAANENDVAVVTALAAGTVTLTANAESTTGQEQVTILSTVSFVPGTVIWSAPPAAGFSPLQLAQAVPSNNGPDLYSTQVSADGTHTVVQALVADGEQLWQATGLPTVNGNSVPDGFGGLIVTENQTCNQGQTVPMSIVDLSPSTGQPLWQITAQPTTNGFASVYCYPEAPQMAIRPDGSVVIAAPGNTSGLPELMLLDGQSGQVLFPLTIPTSSYQNSDGSIVNGYSPIGPPIVDSDGSAYVEYEVLQSAYVGGGPVITAAQLYLLAVAPNNSTTTTQIWSTTDNENLFPGRIIPDGQGGVLATYTLFPSNPPVPPRPYQAGYVVGGSVTITYGLPFSPQTLTFGTYPSLVLGESGIAFATDGTNSDPSNQNDGPQIVSFNISSGAENWAYQTLTQNQLSIVAASAGNAVVGKITDQSGNDTVVRLDSTGAATTDTWSASGVQYGDVGWLGFSTPMGSSLVNAKTSTPGARQLDLQGSGSSPAVFSAAPVPWADSVWLMPQQAATSAAEPAFTLRGISDCEGPTGRTIEYWLVATQGGALVTDPYVVFEHQTDPTVAPPNGVSPVDSKGQLDYSGQKDKFDDDLTPNADPNSHVSTQTFNFGLQGQRLFPVRRIDRTLANSHVPVILPQFLIKMPSGQQATLNGQASPYVGPCSGTYPPN
jgi:hypothetical protein